jgi:hypothetical protein
VNHRAVQRALFRMQLDPGFAARLRAGESEAQLGAAELALLRAADPVALSADRDLRRLGQFLRNVSEEFALSRAAGVPAEGFPRSPEFHEAVQFDRTLPLAFGRYAERCSASGSPGARALAALECALARARRELRAATSPGRDERALAPWAWLLGLPSGTLDLAVRLREALERGAPLPAIGALGEGEEVVLIVAEREAVPFRLRDVQAEPLSPDLARLLDAAQKPRTLAQLAIACGEPESDVAEIAAELVADGVLVAG